MENKNKWIFGIVLNDDEEVSENYSDYFRKENDLTVAEIKELKMAHLFRLSDNIRFTGGFDADIVAWSEEKETYYHTGDFEPIGQVENKHIIALVDENAECEMI